MAKTLKFDNGNSTKLRFVKTVTGISVQDSDDWELVVFHSDGTLTRSSFIDNPNYKLTKQGRIVQQKEHKDATFYHD